jgi:hypothetical protein
MCVLPQESGLIDILLESLEIFKRLSSEGTTMELIVDLIRNRASAVDLDLHIQ